MSSEGLSDTFALLLRENHGRAATLSADAVRAIRRRVGFRWAGRAGALVVVGALGAAAAAGAYGGGRDDAIMSAIPTPSIGFAAATFPLAGGPEFVPASSGLKCGDPAPAPHNVDDGLRLEVTPSDLSFAGQSPADTVTIPSARAVVSRVTNEPLGTVSTSGIDILVVQNGIIEGVFDGDGTQLKTAQSGADHDEWPRLLVAERTHCPDRPRSEPSEVAPGTYQLVAIGRVFSTPESVALSQAMSSTYNIRFVDSEPGADPHAVYLPGSYDCQQLLSDRSVVRACLPDLTTDAVVDAKEGTVTVLYKTKGLIDEFSTVLVSEPLTATVVSSAVLGPADWQPWTGISPFTTLDSFTCGAIGLGLAVGGDTAYHVEATYEPVPVNAKKEGGTFPGTVFAPDAPDGSTVDLLPGARLVFLQDFTLVSSEGMATTNVSTVVASAPLTTARAFTVDRFAGPQGAMFTNDPATLCPGVEPDLSRGNVHTALVGQWRVSAPDGSVTTIDSANDPSVTYGYAR